VRGRWEREGEQRDCSRFTRERERERERERVEARVEKERKREVLEGNGASWSEEYESPAGCWMIRTVREHR